MDVVVLSNARQRLSRSVLGSRLAGDGLLVRMRSTSIGLLGIVTAVCLGLVAFISQLGWPGVLTAPIPAIHSEAGTVHDAIALTRPAAPAPASSSLGGHRPAHPAAAPATSAGGRDKGGRTASLVGGSHQLATGGGAAPSPAPEAQPEPPVEPAPAAPPAPTSSPALPAESPPASTPPGPTTSSASPKDVSSHEGGSKGHKAAGKTESHGQSSEKVTRVSAGKGKAKAPPASPPPPKPAAPPAAAPPPSDKPEAVEPGWGKGGGPGKSDWHRH
jgi:hypothetical protein